MDWLTFAAEIVKEIAWPATTIIALTMLRKPIVGLIPLIQRLKYKDFELEFGRQVKEVKAEAEEELPPAVVPEALPGQSDAMRALALVSPRAAVTEAWREVEAAALVAAQRSGLPLGKREVISPIRLVRELERAGVVDPGKMALFHDLRGLRNQAAHAPDFALSADAALEYVDLARRLADYLGTAGRGDRHSE